MKLCSCVKNVQNIFKIIFNLKYVEHYKMIKNFAPLLHLKNLLTCLEISVQFSHNFSPTIFLHPFSTPSSHLQSHFSINDKIIKFHPLSGFFRLKDCCEACKIGLVIGSTNQQCLNDNSLFGSPWDDIIEDCCTDIREAEDGEGSNETEESESLLHDFHSSIRGIFSSYFLLPHRKHLPKNR